MKSLLDFPIDKVDAVLDTDAYNEIDDQFALTRSHRHTRDLCGPLP